jgi:hypothetical protein
MSQENELYWVKFACEDRWEKGVKDVKISLHHLGRFENKDQAMNEYYLEKDKIMGKCSGDYSDYIFIELITGEEEDTL